MVTVATITPSSSSSDPNASGAARVADVSAMLTSLVPQAMPGCLLYFDADTIPGQAAGTGVAAWPDLSATNKPLLQATAGNQPTYVVNGVGGRPGIRFTGSAGSTMSTAPAALVTNAAQQTVTYIAAIRFIARPSTTKTLLFSNTQYVNVDIGGAFYFNSGSLTALSETTLVGDPHVMRVTIDATTVKTYIDGQLLGSVDRGANVAAWGYQLNVATGTDTTSDFILSALGMFDGRSFQTSDAAHLERYLMAKYHITPVVPTSTAARFIDSLGINIHTSFTSPPGGYGFSGPAPDTNPSKLIPALTTLGIKNVRDQSHPETPAVVALQQAVLAAGIKIGMICQDTSTGGASTIAQHLAQFSSGGALSGGVVHVEPANEYDHTGGSWAATIKAEQAALYSATKADSSLAAITVLGPSFAITPGSATTYGADGAHMDAANIHAYSGGRIAENAILNIALRDAAVVAPGKPFHITETGAHTATGITTGFYGISETAQAIYTLRAYLEGFRKGAYRTFLYELYEEWNDTTGTNSEQRYGLLHADGAPKAGYTALKNFIAILSDSGTPPTGVDLQYSIVSAAGVRQVLLARSDGTYDLILWQPAVVFDPTTGADKTAAAVPAAVTFKTAKQVRTYRPISSATVQSTVVAQAVSVDVGADPIIVRIG